MNLKIISKCLLSTSLCTTALCEAAIMEGSFNGFVSDVFESYGEGSTFRFWNGDITGQAVSGTFWYDSAIPTNIQAGVSTDSASYMANQINWLGMIFNIDGNTFDVSNHNPDGLPPYYVQDKIFINHNGAAADEPELRLYDSIERDTGLGGGMSLQGVITLGNSMSDILSGISLEQEFDWVNQGSPDAGIGEFIYHTSVEGLYANTGVTIYLSDVHVKIRDNVSVPEPFSLGLLTLGLSVLGWRIRNSA